MPNPNTAQVLADTYRRVYTAEAVTEAAARTAGNLFGNVSRAATPTYVRPVTATSWNSPLDGVFATSYTPIKLASLDPEWSNGWSHLWKEIGNAHEAAALCRPYEARPYLRPKANKDPAAPAWWINNKKPNPNLRGASYDYSWNDEVSSIDWAAVERATLEASRNHAAIAEDRGIQAWIPASEPPPANPAPNTHYTSTSPSYGWGSVLSGTFADQAPF